ncbi:MAG TPA: PHP domain-containing protein [Jatrophihabitans sp.]|uniref:PHP domain-containing protein n=1 Tax=Jatrophihabitans sp. TaxID=1932789 RepID=UPI002E08BA9A|nr:PHP domain-containing protein [Jatrophihabitans sp.]
MSSDAAPRDPSADLRTIAFLLERAREPTFRVKAFRTAAGVVDDLPADEVSSRAAAGTLGELTGIGKVTERCIVESLGGEVPVYLRRLQATEDVPLDEATAALRAALRGDCHSHSDWSDGGSPIREMAETARAIGHEYLVLTDHSPRLKVANGLSAERLEQQLDIVAGLNDEFANDGGPPFRLLTGIEVDILDDGTLDQKPSLLARLDLVVASVHSKLRMPAAEMTPRMVAAVANPHTDVLGHCTGRLVTGGRGTRPESEFDAELVFAAAAQFGVAVEINSRPERLDPPKRLLRLAVEAGCLTSIDTDAHAPGQLDWQSNGCERAARCGVEVGSIVNTWTAEQLLAWTSDHSVRP